MLNETDRLCLISQHQCSTIIGRAKFNVRCWSFVRCSIAMTRLKSLRKFLSKRFFEKLSAFNENFLRQIFSSDDFEKIYCSPQDLFDEKSDYELLSRATAIFPADLITIVEQSYKPLNSNSSNQFHRKTIAVSKGVSIRALFKNSNWVFVELLENGQTGFIPLTCLKISKDFRSSSDEDFLDNLSLFNVSIYERFQFD